MAPPPDWLMRPTFERFVPDWERIAADAERRAEETRSDPEGAGWGAVFFRGIIRLLEARGNWREEQEALTGRCPDDPDWRGLTWDNPPPGVDREGWADCWPRRT